MELFGVQIVFVLLLVLPATAETQNGGVTFWKNKVTLTCPEKGDWFNKKDEILESGTKKLKYEFEYKDRVQYHCKYVKGVDETSYFFYVEGKACENCFELDAPLILGVLIVDVVGTIVIMMIVYRCTRKKQSAGPANSSKAQTHSGGRAPPVPHPDYEPLSAHTRSQDPYSFVKRTG